MQKVYSEWIFYSFYVNIYIYVDKNIMIFRI